MTFGEVAGVDVTDDGPVCAPRVRWKTLDGHELNIVKMQ